VVVRWFGGVKLGTGGLARAYRETAKETLRLAKTVDRFDYVQFRVVVRSRCSATHTGSLMRARRSGWRDVRGAE